MDVVGALHNQALPTTAFYGAGQQAFGQDCRAGQHLADGGRYGRARSGKRCGRTDAGVHAEQYFLHTDLPLTWDPQQLIFKLNRMTPPDLAFFQAWEMQHDLHARFDATQRTYRYFIHQQKNPFKEFSMKGFCIYKNQYFRYQRLLLFHL